MASYRLFPSISSRDKEAEPTTTEDIERTPTCGYNGCARTVEHDDDHCWQHP